MIFPYIETYIEFLSDLRDNTGSAYGWSIKNNIQLASYDIGFVRSVAESTMFHNKAMTTKQAELSYRLIAKYEKQLTNRGVDQPTHTNHRLGIREVKYENSLSIENDKAVFRFTYNDKIISSVKEFAKGAQGEMRWSREDRAWISAITEYNISWLVAFSNTVGIAVSAEAQKLFDLIIESENSHKDITLAFSSNGDLVIENGPTSMTEYITENIGYDDLLKLVDYSGMLAYKVSDEIINIVAQEKGEIFVKLCTARNIDIQENMSEVIRWAKETNRLPICVYNPNLLNLNLDVFKEHFTDDEMQIFGPRQYTKPVDFSKKFVYTNKVIPWEGKMPLLITYANLMHGATKKGLSNKAEKIVYYCPTLPR